MYFVEGKTQSEIAQALGVNRIAIVRCLADARRRNEVRITIAAPMAELAGIERAVQDTYGIERVIVAPVSDPEADPTQVIAAAAGKFIGEEMRSGLTVGVGWGRTLHASLPFIAGRTLDDFRVVSLLGGIAAARRFNPAEFAWQFAELFQGEGFLIPAPAIVDSPETKHALLERCGLAEIFAMVDRLDIALLSVGGIATITTSYRMGHLSEPERRALVEAGAVGDILYNFVNEQGRTVDNQVNARAIAVDLDKLRRTPQRVVVSGGREKVAVLRGAIARLAPTVLITDEITAGALLDRKTAEPD
ncbi:MAG: sugar-binding transcriptional regulator [Rhodobacteraceae bacterium]|nr:sugar-binding transcriptional regulator [Paracoccaceae bacterium]